jgi:hypothetical protein
VVIFGLVAITDWLRGGYKKLVTDQHLGETPDKAPAIQTPLLKKDDFSRR